jgi:sigma-B regulation protein RsbU (phosphoserine phosphatase)
VLRAAGTVDALPASGPPVGWFPEAAFTPGTAELAPGDALLLYTDGLSEARRGTELLGEEGIRELLAGAAGQSTEVIAERVQALLAGLDTRDDTAILVVRAR